MPNRMLHKLYVDAVMMAKADEEDKKKAQENGKPQPIPRTVSEEDVLEQFGGG